MMTCEKNQYRGSCARCGTYIGLLGGCDCEVPREYTTGYYKCLLPGSSSKRGLEWGWVAIRKNFPGCTPRSVVMPTKEMALADLERVERSEALRRLVYEGGVTWDDLIPKASPKALEEQAGIVICHIDHGPDMTTAPVWWNPTTKRAEQLKAKSTIPTGGTGIATDHGNLYSIEDWEAKGNVVAEPVVEMPKAIDAARNAEAGQSGWTRDAARAAIDAARNGGYKAIRNWEPAEG